MRVQGAECRLMARKNFGAMRHRRIDPMALRAALI
jgi:hypothetical protein